MSFIRLWKMVFGDWYHHQLHFDFRMTRRQSDHQGMTFELATAMAHSRSRILDFSSHPSLCTCLHVASPYQHQNQKRVKDNLDDYRSTNFGCELDAVSLTLEDNLWVNTGGWWLYLLSVTVLSTLRKDHGRSIWWVRKEKNK